MAKKSSFALKQLLPEENPKTGAMMSILPYISYFGSASNIYNLCNEILSFMKRNPQ